MVRTVYKGAVRDSAAEHARDTRMLRLAEQGVPVSVIAQRMGVTVNSVRTRIKRAHGAIDSAAPSSGSTPTLADEDRPDPA